MSALTISLCMVPLHCWIKYTRSVLDERLDNKNPGYMRIHHRMKNEAPNAITSLSTEVVGQSNISTGDY